MFIKLSPQYSILDLSRQVMARRDWIERALTAVWYQVKPHIVTYLPGRAAVLSRVIVKVS